MPESCHALRWVAPGGGVLFLDFKFMVPVIMLDVGDLKLLGIRKFSSDVRSGQGWNCKIQTFTLGLWIILTDFRGTSARRAARRFMRGATVT